MPHREAAEILAQHQWPRLYDAAVLGRNDVPVAATIYVNDLYVERRFAEETAQPAASVAPATAVGVEVNGVPVKEATQAAVNA